jgi:hypothetical protein
MKSIMLVLTIVSMVFSGMVFDTVYRVPSDSTRIVVMRIGSTEVIREVPIRPVNDSTYRITDND